MLARLEGRTPSVLMRELLTLGLAQYVNIYYRTPQLVRQQELKALFSKQLEAAKTLRASQAKTRSDVQHMLHRP